jgi:hypothetical protein
MNDLEAFAASLTAEATSQSVDLPHPLLREWYKFFNYQTYTVGPGPLKFSNFPEMNRFRTVTLAEALEFRKTYCESVLLRVGAHAILWNRFFPMITNEGSRTWIGLLLDSDHDLGFYDTPALLIADLHAQLSALPLGDLLTVLRDRQPGVIPPSFVMRNEHYLLEG